PQDEALATFSGIIEKKDATIDWTRSAADIERAIRAYDPWPVARTRCGGEELMVWRARVENANASGDAGTLASLKPEVVVQCGSARLVLLEVQAPGRKRIAAIDYARGKRLSIGERLG